MLFVVRLGPGRLMLLVIAGCGADDGAGAEEGSGSAASSEESGGAQSDGPAEDDAADSLGGLGDSTGGGHPWICGDGIGLLGSGSLTWADPAAFSGGVTSLQIDGAAVDTALDTAWSSQVEHWGPCFTIDQGRVGLVLAMGPEVMGDAQSQIRIGVLGGVGTYPLDTTLQGAVLEDPSVYVFCSTIRDGGYFGGPGFSPGQTLAATGTLEIVSLPQADGEELHLILEGSHDDGFCSYSLDVHVTVPDGYFAAVGD